MRCYSCLCIGNIDSLGDEILRVVGSLKGNVDLAFTGDNSPKDPRQLPALVAGRAGVHTTVDSNRLPQPPT